ncbi:MAG: valine--tRNA ligase [Candidatus Lightella neohaematopini]|nr:valine--tRNA ligase [Candidatus Lightella neohaematopini]
MNNYYNPKDIEQSIYRYWEKNNLFQPTKNNKKNYCIVIPPPNITGKLHIGHAYQYTLIDILIRYNKMQGKNTLWQMGTDHAGIAMQITAEKIIKNKYNKIRTNYNREDFIKEIWKIKDKFNSYINYQIKRLGNSVYWGNNRFTLDHNMSSSVKSAFIKLYNDNLIYKGKKLVNWDFKLKTAISDLEVVNREHIGNMWYLRYPLANNQLTINNLNYLVVATTRPETILGDVAIAVNPYDNRYQNLIGKYAILPILNKQLPIIADKYVDIKKGTGCVKITPAHDFNDYKIGKKHNLSIINIFSKNGTILNKPEIFNKYGVVDNKNIYNIPYYLQGLDRFQARNIIVNKLKDLNLVDDIKLHKLIISYNNRNNEIIEPLLTSQWYMRTSKLSKLAVNLVKNGYIKFIPKHYENLYFNWMKDIQDWCISRQIWWGHRIPAWYDIKNNVYVGNNEQEIRLLYNIDKNTALYQDDDVLDTWFSSSLWTFASLGWPKNTILLKMFHPTNLVISGFDIIFFWIARMIMLTSYLVKNHNHTVNIPFKTVYITGLVCDELGQKMSKSKGNIIDPIDIIDGISLKNLIYERAKQVTGFTAIKNIIKYIKNKFPNGINAYGADALRFALTAMSSSHKNINYNINQISSYYNFCNKLWQVSRFVLLNSENFCNYELSSLSLIDKWILIELNKTIKNFKFALDSYRFDLAVNILYTFVWHQFCDWYIELAKINIKNGSLLEIKYTKNTLLLVLKQILLLIHPIIPFITEYIWQCINKKFNNNESIILQPFPNCKLHSKNINDINILNSISLIKNIISTVRKMRSEININNNTLIKIILSNISNEEELIILNNSKFIKNIAKLRSIIILNNNKEYNYNYIYIFEKINNIKLIIPLNNLDKKILYFRFKKIESHLIKVEKKIQILNKKLFNNKFIKCAPKIIISDVKNKLEKYNETKLTLIKQKMLISNYIK